MSEHHDHGILRSGNQKGLSLALGITALFMIVEFIGGYPDHFMVL